MLSTSAVRSSSDVWSIQWASSITTTNGRWRLAWRTSVHTASNVRVFTISGLTPAMCPGTPSNSTRYGALRGSMSNAVSVAATPAAIAAGPSVSAITQSWRRIVATGRYGVVVAYEKHLPSRRAASSRVASHSRSTLRPTNGVTRPRTPNGARGSGELVHAAGELRVSGRHDV